MRPTIIVAVMLIALGIAAFAYRGITCPNRENVVEIGPIQITAQNTCRSNKEQKAAGGNTSLPSIPS